MSIMVSTRAFLEQRLAELRQEIAEIEKQLKIKKKVAAVVQRALPKLPPQSELFPEEDKRGSELGQLLPQPETPQAEARRQKNDMDVALRALTTLPMSIGRAAKRILRDSGRPMSPREILQCLHTAGRTDVKLESLTSVLGKMKRSGKVVHPEHGYYAIPEDENVLRTLQSHSKK